MAPRLPTPRHPPARPQSTALAVVDQRPIQRRAWAEFHRAQTLRAKAARDLHRHEKTDTPAFERWLHAAFPTLATLARELHTRVETRSRHVQAVQTMAAITGRSLKKLWREHKEYLADPEAFERAAAAADAAETLADAQARASRNPSASDARFDDDHPHDHDTLFEDDGEAYVLDPFAAPARPAPDTAARDLYRRLVQRLHPDRGGKWTPDRERLWHEVQQAWAARDTDWLARLDIEWESAHDVINEHSSIARLRRAIEELRAAHRDTERRLHTYRQAPAWRFTLSEKKRVLLHRRTEADLRHEIDLLQRQLDYLEKTIAAWEEPVPSRKGSRPGRAKQTRTRH